MRQALELQCDADFVTCDCREVTTTLIATTVRSIGSTGNKQRKTRQALGGSSDYLSN